MSHRDKPIHFAALTWQNLEFIEEAAQHNPGVAHRVTQLALSLLGLIVLQYEKNRDCFDRAAKKLLLAELSQQGWPFWAFTRNNPEKQETYPPASLFELIKQLRHVVAHGGVTFSSDSPNYVDVNLNFNNPDKNWHVEISALDVREFCRRFKNLLEDCIASDTWRQNT